MKVSANFKRLPLPSWLMVVGTDLNTLSDNWFDTATSVRRKQKKQYVIIKGINE